MNTQTIGEIIENEVRKQSWSITEFAEQINCKRNNVYDIFSRNNIDIQLLARISKVLNHNYFKDLAENPDLVCEHEEETEKEVEKRKAVSQFLDVMPVVLRELNMDPTITFSNMNNGDDIPLPDLSLPDYLVCFTIGERWVEKVNKKQPLPPLIKVQTINMENGEIIDIVNNTYFGSAMIDIKLDYKTQDQWFEIMKYVKENCLQYAKLPHRFFHV
jgi:plasmid maintenance system antidote protein VapI